MLTNHYSNCIIFSPPEILQTMVWGWYYHASFTGEEMRQAEEINLLKRHKQLSGFSSGGFMAVSTFWPLTAVASQREWTDKWTRVDESSRWWWSLRNLTSSFLTHDPRVFSVKWTGIIFAPLFALQIVLEPLSYLQQAINLRSALTSMATSTYMLLLSTWNEARLSWVML